VTDVPRGTTPPPPPPEAAVVFGDRLELATAYAGWLAGPGTERGLLGPREVDRLWERHLLNCAVLGEVVPHGVTVADLGSGAGLPGIPLALARPDLEVTLVEPLLRRATFLTEVVGALGLARVEVVRSRAEDLHGQRSFAVVASRAVAPLERLLGWSVPLADAGGLVVALKGASAGEEVAALGGRPRVWEDLGVEAPEVLSVGCTVLSQPATVVRAVVGPRRRLRSRGTLR
jgi:16S rRNA (guanine527-N7)-methyltransferase